MKISSRTFWGVAAGALLMFLLIIGAALLVIHTGSYNVSASSGHTLVGRWALETTMRNAVQRQAAGLEPPVRFTPAEIAAGGGEYKAMCQHCHGGPGVERAGWASGIVPSPPELSQAAKEWRPNEIFWIVKHGIKMSGMPAFGADYDDPTLWNIAAFVDALSTMTPEQYAAIPMGHGDAAQASESGHTGHTH